MKKFYLLLILALPMRVLAQPVIHYCDDYTPGDILAYVNCDTTGANPGPGGASQTWDLSSLTTAPPGTDTLQEYFIAGSGSISVIDSETSGGFPTTNAIYMNTDTGQTSVLGTLNPYITYTTPQSLSRRPNTYNDSFNSTFKMTGGLNGEGGVEIVADGYGTLVLPNGTYSNVLRVVQTIKENTVEADSITTINYFWYDDMHVGPLCAISIINFGAEPIKQSVIYLGHETTPSPLTAKNIATPKQLAFSGNLTSAGLTIQGNFEQNHLYKMAITNLVGQKLYTSEFTGSSEIQFFDLDRDLSASVYLVSVTDENNIASTGTIKVLKQ